jgi:TPR repeat protein
MKKIFVGVVLTTFFINMYAAEMNANGTMKYSNDEYMRMAAYAKGQGSAEVAVDMGKHFKSAKEAKQWCSSNLELEEAYIPLATSVCMQKLGFKTQMPMTEDLSLSQQGDKAYKAHDFKKAFVLYGKACNDTDVSGCFGLATLYSIGLGVKYNEAKSKEIYKKACDGGIADACQYAN